MTLLLQIAELLVLEEILSISTVLIRRGRNLYTALMSTPCGGYAYWVIAGEEDKN